MSKLEIRAIEAFLTPLGHELCFFESCASTMQQIEKYENIGTNYIVITENQTTGVGRLGSAWNSEPGKDLIFTIHTIFEEFPHNLSINIGICVLNALKKFYNLPVKFKWPNDIYLNNYKLCGILVQNTNCKVTGKLRTKMGIGLNVNSTPNAFISIKQFLGVEVNRTTLFQRIFNALLGEALTKIPNSAHIWNTKLNPADDYLNSKKIELYIAEKRYIGLYKGYSKDGIILQKSQYETVTYNNASKIKVL